MPILLVSVLLVDVPAARSALDAPAKTVGTTETLNVYPSEVGETAWRNFDQVLSPDLSSDALYQDFSARNSANLRRERTSSVEGLPPTPGESIDSVDVTTPVDTSESLRESESQNETSPVEAVPAESVSPTVEISAPESEPISILKRATESVFAFFSVATQEQEFAQETVVTETPTLPTETASESEQSPVVLPINEVAPDDVSSQSNESSTTPEVDSAQSDLTNPADVLGELDSSVQPDGVSEETVTTQREQTITLSDFSTLALQPGEFVRNMQLRASLAGRAEINEDGSFPYLELTMRTASSTQVIGSVILDGEVSNALNGGHFLFAFPQLVDIADLEQTAITVSYVGDTDTLEAVYLDALWLEIEIETIDVALLKEKTQTDINDLLRDPVFHTILSEQVEFTQSELPRFSLRYNSQRNVAVRFFRELAGRDLAAVADVSFVHEDVGDIGVLPKIDVTSDGLMTIQIEEEDRSRLRPGEYTVVLSVAEGGETYTDSFSFQWGMLSINSDQTSYVPGQLVTMSMGALSPNGNTVCDASLQLYLIDPNNGVVITPVTPSGVCNGNNVIDVPDYSASLTPSLVGEYEMYLERVDAAGNILSHTSGTFLVEAALPLSLERNGPSRIYPRATYPMAITVHSDDVWNGTLVEVVPADFVVTETDARIKQVGDTLELTWDVSVDAATPQTFTYTFDAPDISPFLYSLGAARLEGLKPMREVLVTDEVDPEEPEQQIDIESPAEPIPTPANEETPTETAPAPASETAVETVPEVPVVEPITEPIVEPVEEGPSVIEEIPVIDETEVAPVSIMPALLPYAFMQASADVAATATESAIVATPAVSDAAATPSTEEVQTQNIAFIEHRQWQIASDATGSMLAYWTNGASIPAGWTCLSCGSGTFYQRFVQGNATYNSSGGAATHNHTASGTVNASATANAENRAGTFVSIASHSHTYTPTITASTSLPAYRNMRVIQNNSAGEPATVPAGVVMMFDSTLPSGWARYAALDSRYPRGETTIGNAGSSTHRHTISGSTAAAAGTLLDSRTGGTQVTSAAGTHTHTVASNTGYINHEPPYISVLFATSSIATSTPTGAITMWTDTPPAQWQNQSAQVGDPFYGKFIKGSATYGTTGGADSHTHSNVTGITTSAAVGTDNARSGTTGASNVHTHTADVTSFTTESNLPPYVTAIFGKKFGPVPLYTQSAYRFYANTNAITPTDAWPVGGDALLENEPIDSSSVPVKNADVVRLRMQLSVSNSTSTSEIFKLQFATTTAVCSDATSWTDVGNATSSAVWRGYNNAGVSDGVTLSSTTISGTDRFGSYEETNPSVTMPVTVGIAEQGEWDFVIQQNNAVEGSTYCFRMVENDGTQLFTYSQYPTLLTNQAPDAPTLSTLFDNEKVATTTPDFEFTTSDAESNDLTYQIQVDDDYSFGSVAIDRNSTTNGSQFDNLQTPADKDPFTQGELIRFTNTTALTNGTTYYWRVRAKDPTGSNAQGSWSTVYSFTVDTSLTFSTWFQTTDEQFNTNTLNGVEGVTDQAQLRTGSTTGTMHSDPITFSEASVGTAWGSFSFSDTETSSDLKYTIQYNNSDVWTDIPDAVLSGNAAGFDTSPVSLLGVDKTIYDELRIEANFTNSGATPSVQDWTVTWSYLIETPTIDAPFSNEKVATTTPTFQFLTTDPQNDSLQYQIQWSTTYAFTASTTRNSNINAGFTNITNGGDTDPFNSSDIVQFKIQPGDALTNGTTYWWRVRARDPLGSNTYSFFTDPQSFTVDTTIAVSTWFQTTQSQFAIDTLSNTVTQASNIVTVATTTDDSLIAYAEGTVTTPRYRLWDGNTWGTESDALDVGAAQTWAVTKASPIESEYILATMGTDADVNIQVFRNGAWGDLQEVTTAIANTNMRGFDVAYEQSSGDAMVVTCDGDADPTYWLWNGTSWTNGGAIGLAAGNTCGWVKLISDPTSDEIIVVTRDTSGTAYEARVWSGSAWGNGAIWGSIQSTQTTHEGIAAEYEDSGNQAVVAVSNGTGSSFSWRAWNGSAWSAATSYAIGDDFESGTLVADDGSDNLALCYHDEDGDIGAARWTGAGWAGVFTELETVWTNATAQFNDRPVDCAFEVGGARDGYIMVAYADTTNLRYRFWNGATWAVEASISTVQDAPRVQLRRTRENILQVMAYDNTNDRYDYSDWNGTTWSLFQTLESNGAAGASPYKEPFMIAATNPSVNGTVVGEAVDFYAGSGPYWQQLSWVDTTGGSSNILYQVEYYDGDSWELVPNGLIPGNSAGTTTSPINLANVLPVSTYDQIRPVANMSCNLGTCPSLSDWTITWAAGITISGTAQQYNQSTNVTSGTVGVAVNGVLQIGKTGTIAAGAWSIANVNVAPSDVVTVFISGAADANEAVATTRYDGVGDMSGIVLYERHATIGSNDAATVSNVDLGLYDFTNTEDIFYNVSGTDDVAFCATSGCADVELFIKALNTFTPGSGADVTTHDFENNGTFTMGANTIRVNGSWDNNATTSPQTATVIMTATSTSETFDETGATSPSFYNLTFGETSGTATWTLVSALNIDNNLTVSFGTLARNSRALTVARNLTTGASGLWTGIGTTTFDGSVSSVWSDASAGVQNIGRVVVDGSTKTISLGSNTKAQSLTIGADDIFDLSTSNFGITVYGSWVNSNTFNARSGTVTMAATSTGKIITAGSDAFYDLTFTGSGGAWSFTESQLSVNNNFSLSNGIVTMPTATTTIAGSFLNTGGTFAHNNSVINFTGTGSKTLTLAGTAFTNAFYNVRFGGSGTYTFSEANATTSNDMRIAAGTVVFPTTQLSLGGSLYQTAGAITSGTGTTRFYSASAESITINSSLASVLIAAAGPFTFTNTNATLTGGLTINAGSLTLPSGTLSLGGSLDNNATLVPQTGAVLFNSTAGSETVALGSSSLHNVTFNSATGIWNVTESATTTNTTLTAGTFTLTSGRALAVSTLFTNAMNAASTTWSGTTLALNGSTFSINTKAAQGDTYATLRIAASADVSMWNSSASTVTVLSGGSLYSQDNAALDGELYVYGAYERSAGIEYWSYATDFDGTSLGGGSRPVAVKFDSGATAAFTNATLQILGVSTATTTVSNQGAGTYIINVTGGTTTAQYYSIDRLGATGVSLSGVNEVTSLSYGAIKPGTGGGTGLTVSSTTIDANPGLQIYNVNFSTSSPIVANNVKQVDGTPTSFWWFRNSSGGIDGEANDFDTGNPGSIRWDDSSLSITVSGTVYSDAGVTPLIGGTCDGATNVVRVVVENGATYNGTCSNVDGTYSIGGVAVVGDPTVTVYLNDASGGQRATTITKTPTADITGLDLYAHRVILRHQDTAPMTIADMNAFENANDSDVRFVAATSTSGDSLTVLSGTELYVWSQKTFTPGGSVTISGNAAGNSYDGSLFLAATSTFTGYGTTTYTIAGTLTQSAGANFIPASSTVVMNATTSGKAITAAAGQTIDFNVLSFTGVSGAWNINAALLLTSNMNVAAGTVTGTSNITLQNGSLSGNGLFSFGGGTVLIAKTNTLGGTQGWTFNNLTLGNGSVVGTTTPGSTSTTTVGGVLTIANAHFLDAGALNLTLSGTGSVLVETGTFLEDTSTVRYSGTAANVTATNYYNLVLNSGGGSQTYTATGIGISVGNNLIVGSAAASIFNLDTNDTVLSVVGDVTIASNGTLVASNSGSFTTAGSWDNDGTFTASGGTVRFTSVGAETIAAGVSSFATARFLGVGSYTLTEHATATAALSLANLSGFTLASGQTLAVGGTFNNYVGGAATTWTGATLSLYGGGNYLINPATTTDSYGTLIVSGSTQIRSWNSTATSINVGTNSSLYSMDHANVAGDLYVYGDYQKSNGTDHWSYASDFDGTSLGGGARKVDVFFENGATAVFSGTSQLSVRGATAASTTLQNQGSGTYAFAVGGSASTTMQYYEVFDTTSTGLTFTGSAQVQNLSYGYIEVGANSSSAITVGGSVITASPARTFTYNTFATSTGVSAATNVTATGTSVSSWRFTNHAGAIDGEAYDSDPDGDPGYIVWDNSAASITVSGRVYSDEGSTVSTNCDGVTNNIVVRVAGLTSYTTTCNAVTGAYAVTGVTYSPGDSIVAYLDGESVGAATVTADPVSNINNMDLYERRVIVRHESASPLSIDDMALWDSADDADIPFTATNGAPDVLILPANYKLLVWTGKTFAPGGNVTVSGGGAGAAYDGTLELQAGAVWTSVGTQAHSIGGSLIAGAGATWTPGNSTTTFTTTGAARTIDINNGSFYNVAFTGSGSWTITDTLLDVQSFAQTTGALTLPTGTTTISGSFNATGGSFSQNGPFVFDGVGTHVMRFDGSNAGPLYVTGAGSFTMADTNATSTGSLIKTAGALTLPSGVLALGGGFENQSGAITHSSGRVIISSATVANLKTSGSDLGSVTFTGGGTFAMEDTSLTLAGSLTLNGGSLTLATGTLAIGGSFAVVSGMFDHATGTVLFNSSDTGETISPGTSAFYNVNFGSATGGFTLTTHATTTNNFTVTAAANFTLTSGQTLAVGGVFTNSVGGSATTWTGSTLRLLSGTQYQANTKLVAGDNYQTLVVGNDTDVRFWNSTATTTTVAASASLYSQDHATVNGALYIYGDYHIGTTTDYWSYATDFDGTALGGSSRVVTVAMAQNATTTVDGGSLQIVGATGNDTTITNQGSGTYGFVVNAGTYNALYYAYRNLNVDGLQFSGIPTITSLTEGDFELAVNGGSLISLSSTTLNANASLVISGVRFATTSAITGYNVNLTGSTTNAWTFVSHTGNLDGEAYDIDGVDACGSVRFDDSACLLTQQVHYRWRHDDGGSDVPNTEWFDGSWNKRQRVRMENVDATTYTDAVIELTVPYDADMQSDFDDLRFTDASGTTTVPFWIERYTASTQATVWVKVPSLAASDIATVFMYYNNAGAASAGSSATTFVVADDFEDAGITEYSGDTALFAVDGSFAYGGSYGLDNTGDEGNVATDGIARFDQTVSQGETIRFMQYVSTGTGDETCTLFAVQSPVTANQNYAICLEQYGVDRVSIVENAENTDGTGTLLASTTAITYAAGWYQVEVAWGTGGDIDVTVSKNGVVQATVSANDSSHTSGGIGFTYWSNYGGFDNFTSRPLLTTEPTVYFGAEQVDGGASWAAALDTAASGFESGDVARLRLLIENSGLTVTNQEYQLEYAELGAAPSCEAVSGATYVAVPVQASCGSSPVCMQSSTYFADGDAASDLLTEANGTFTLGELVEDPSNTADPLTINQNEYTELEYAITPTVNTVDENLCFRVTNVGDPIDTYLKVAKLSLRFSPVISNVIFNDGLPISLLPGTTTRVYATGTVTDLNGYADIVAATSTMYTSSSTAACAADTNDCYITSTDAQCNFTNSSGNNRTLVCYADFLYHADPTDDNGTDWYAFFEVEDAAGGYDFYTSTGIDVATLHALDVTQTINFGSLSASSTSGATNASSIIENLGNAAIDINLNGVDLSDGYGSAIPVTNQKFATSTFNYDSCPTGCYNLATTAATLEVDLGKPVSLAPITDTVYWGIRVPFGVSSAPHTGVNTFSTEADTP